MVLFENSIVCQCTFFKYFFHAPWHFCLLPCGGGCVVVFVVCVYQQLALGCLFCGCFCVVGCVNMNCFGCGGFSSSDAP